MRTEFITLKNILLASFLMMACDNGDAISNGNGNGDNTWDIPQDQVFDGGPGKDGIPALENPNLISVPEVTYLSDGDLVLGYKNGTEVIAYPHPILDWHEIINDKVNGHAFSVVYCPLTGTGTGWERVIDGQETTFGVSGLLYNSNLIPYDRRTNSNWSQIRLDCVNGELRGADIETFNLVETTWKTWKEMYPDSKVVSTSTGHSRNYQRYPYGDYKTNNNNIIFPFSPNDTRLPAKERVLGIIGNSQKKAFQFSSFAGNTRVIEDVIDGEPIIVVGNKGQNFLVSFYSELEDGTQINFTIDDSQLNGTPNSILLKDDEGNQWNIFGEAVAGPRQGEKLRPTTSFIGYWFSWGAFYSGIEISDGGM
jgi:hypothetical protein